MKHSIYQHSVNTAVRTAHLISTALFLSTALTFASNARSQNPTTDPVLDDSPSRVLLEQVRPHERGRRQTSDTASRSRTTRKKCKDIAGAVCLDRPPSGWSGPIQPQSSSSPSSLQPCSGAARADVVAVEPLEMQPNAMKNIFVDGVSVTPAECGGCEAELRPVECLPTRLVVKQLTGDSSSPCGEIDSFLPPAAPTGTCRFLPMDRQLPRGFAWGAIPATPTALAPVCNISTPGITNVAQAEYSQFHRMCAGNRLSSACGTNEICTAFDRFEEQPRLAKACIYRSGIHSCPAGPYSEKLSTLYGWLSDTRSCGSCTTSPSPGELKCAYDLRVSADDPEARCANSKPVDADKMCLIQKNPEIIGPKDYFPHTIYSTWDKTATFSGKCETPDWGPRGEAKLEIPVTVCCQDLPLPSAR